MRKVVIPEYIFGNGARRLAGRYAANFSARCALVVSDEGVVAAGWVEEVLASLAESGIRCVCYTGVTTNPTLQDVVRGVEAAGRVRHHRGRGGVMQSIIRTVTDITALKEAARAKDQFLMILSHELKTPLTSILGWAQAAQDLPDVIPQALETIVRNALDQKWLLEDLLDVSRIVTGRLTVTRQPVELWPLVEESVAALTPSAEEHQIALHVEPPEQPLPLDGDPGRLRQAVRNVLDNAIKYTPAGGSVTVSGTREGSWAVLTVRDTGRGIAQEDLPKLFTPFQQISRTEDVGGLGLGLVLIRGIVRAHRGRVTVESPGLGKGSTFRIWLPLRADTPGEGG